LPDPPAASAGADEFRAYAKRLRAVLDADRSRFADLVEATTKAERFAAVATRCDKALAALRPAAPK
jgi:glucuronate isomerase